MDTSVLQERLAELETRYRELEQSLEGVVAQGRQISEDNDRMRRELEISTETIVCLAELNAIARTPSLAENATQEAELWLAS